MESLLIYKSKRGFTLIEILVVVGVVGLIISVGAFMDIGSFNRELLGSEQNTIVSLLHKARSRAMNNINHSPHGVHMGTSEYIVFVGNTYNSSASTNQYFIKSEKMSIDTSDIGTSNIVFKQLSGETEDHGSIIIDDGTKTKTIEVMENGLIKW